MRFRQFIIELDLKYGFGHELDSYISSSVELIGVIVLYSVP